MVTVLHASSEQQCTLFLQLKSWLTRSTFPSVSQFTNFRLYIFGWDFPFTNGTFLTAPSPGFALQPLAEQVQGEAPLVTVDMSVLGGPLRCRRCKAYINPHVKFVDGGRKFICNLCNVDTEVNHIRSECFPIWWLLLIRISNFDYVQWYLQTTHRYPQSTFVT